MMWLSRRRFSTRSLRRNPGSQKYLWSHPLSHHELDFWNGKNLKLSISGPGNQEIFPLHRMQKRYSSRLETVISANLGYPAMLKKMHWSYQQSSRDLLTVRIMLIML